VNLSLPSLRVDSFSLELMEKAQKVRKSGLTFAPEAGTQRLRNVINKGVTEEDLIKSVSLAFEGGWSGVKLYFMLGLPTESYEDIEGIAELGHKVVEAYKNTPKDKRGKGLSVTISTSSFVPKPFTPFQWEPQDSIETLREKQIFLKSKIKSKSIKYNWHDPELSFLEAILPAETENWVKCCLRLLRKAASLTVGESTSNLTNGWRLSVNAELTLHSMPTGKGHMVRFCLGIILMWECRRNFWKENMKRH